MGGWLIKDRVRTNSIKQLRPATSKEGSKKSSGARWRCYETYTTWTTILCSADGQCYTRTEEEVTGNYCVYEDEPETLAPDGPVKGGGGGSPSEPTDPNEDCDVPEGNLLGVIVDCEEEEEEEEIFEIINEVGAICLRKAVEKAISGGFNSEISRIIENHFNKNENVNLIIRDSDQLPMDLDGKFDAQNANGYWSLTITLNRSVLNQASQEYIMSTVYHEFLHGYFQLILGENISGEDQEHELMANEYIKKLALALQEVYSIGYNEARSLSWGGLRETMAYRLLPDFVKLGSDLTGTTSGIQYELMKQRVGENGTECELPTL